MRNVIKSKKGITLMELMVGGFLFGLIVLTVATVLAPMMRTSRIAADFAEYNHILDSVGNMIVSEIAQSSTTTTGAAVSMTRDNGSTRVELRSEAGRLQRRTSTNAGATWSEWRPVFHDGFYEGKLISFNVAGTAPNYTVTVEVSAPGSIVTTAAVRDRDYAVRLLF